MVCKPLLLERQILRTLERLPSITTRTHAQRPNRQLCEIIRVQAIVRRPVLYQRVALRHPRRLIRDRFPGRELRDTLQRLELDEGSQEGPSRGREAGRPGAGGRVAGEGAVEEGGAGVDLGGAGGAEDGVRADVAPCCGCGGFVGDAVVAGGWRVAGCVGGVGAVELNLVVAEGGVGGEVLEGLGRVEGGVEDVARGGEVVGFEEVGGECVGWGL